MAETTSLLNAEPEEIASCLRFLRRVATSLVRSEDLADDLAQDTLLRTIKAGVPTGPKRWSYLRTICKNLLRQRLRTETREKAREALSARREEIRNLPSSDHLGAAKAIVEALERLDPKSYDVIRLRYFEGWPPRKIAAHAQEPLATTKRRLERALLQLRTLLRKGDGRLPSAILALAGPVLPLTAAATVSAAVGGTAVTKSMIGALAGVLLACGFFATWVTSQPSEEPDGAWQSDTVAEANLPADQRDEGEDANPDRPAPIPTQPFVPDRLSPVIASADRETDIFGWVHDEDHRPIENAIVRAYREPWTPWIVDPLQAQTGKESLGETRTDATGAFSLKQERGAFVMLSATASGRVSISDVRATAGEMVRLEMRTGVKLGIQVVDASGKPVEGAVVDAEQTLETPEGRTVVTRGRGVTNGAGAFESRDFLPGELRIDVDAQGFALCHHETISLETAANDPHIITLERGRKMRGTVYDQLTRFPLAGARIHWHWHFDSRQRDIVSDKNGHFEIDGGDPDPGLLLSVSAPGYLDRKQWLQGEVDFEVELFPIWPVIGKVVSETGAPVGEARVLILGNPHAPSSHEIGIRTTTTDADGKFRLDLLHLTRMQALALEKNGKGRTIIEVDPLAIRRSRSAPLTFVMPEGRRLVGEVRDLEGRALPGIAISITRELGTKDLPVANLPSIQDAATGGSRRRTDDLGRFHFADLSPGKYTLSAEIPGSANLSRDVVIEPGRDCDSVVLRPRNNIPLDLLFVDGKENPVPELAVVVQLTSGGTLTGSSDAVGKLALPGVPSGISFDVSVSIQTDKWNRQDYAALLHDGTIHRLVVQRFADISGVAMDERGVPLGRYHIGVVRNGNQVSSTFTDAQGAFQASAPIEGPVDLVLNGTRTCVTTWRKEVSRWRGTVSSVQAPADHVKLIASELRFDRKLEVLVRNPDGGVADAATVVVTFGNGGRNALVDDVGAAQLADLPNEAITIFARPKENTGLAVSEIIRVVPQGETVTLHLRRLSMLRGRVLNRDGRAADAEIRVSDPSGNTASTRTSENGAFLLEVPEDAPLEIEATLRDAESGGLTIIRASKISSGTECLLTPPPLKFR